jgi:hypothetical protein
MSNKLLPPASMPESDGQQHAFPPLDPTGLLYVTEGPLRTVKDPEGVKRVVDGFLRTNADYFEQYVEGERVGHQERFPNMSTDPHVYAEQPTLEEWKIQLAHQTHATRLDSGVWQTELPLSAKLAPSYYTDDSHFLQYLERPIPRHAAQAVKDNDLRKATNAWLALEAGQAIRKTIANTAEPEDYDRLAEPWKPRLAVEMPGSIAVRSQVEPPAGRIYTEDTPTRARDTRSGATGRSHTGVHRRPRGKGSASDQAA